MDAQSRILQAARAAVATGGPSPIGGATYDAWGVDLVRDTNAEASGDPVPSETGLEVAHEDAQSMGGGFKGIGEAINPHNPLLWLLVLVLFLTGLVAASFHLRVGRRSVSVNV